MQHYHQFNADKGHSQKNGINEKNSQWEEEEEDLSRLLGLGQSGSSLEQHDAHPGQTARESSVHHLGIKVTKRMCNLCITVKVVMGVRMKQARVLSILTLSLIMKLMTYKE